MHGHKKRRVDLQLSATFKLPRGYRPSAALVREAVEYKIEHGHDHDRVIVRIVGWNTSDGHHGSPHGIHDESLAWKRFRGVLLAASYHVEGA